MTSTSTNFISGPNNEVHIDGGQFINADKVYYSSSSQALNVLNRHIAPGALLNSNERFDPPRCDHGTRLAIIERIMDWVTDIDGCSSIMWLRGPAGSGKSALAQSIAEQCKEIGILAAVFFMSRNSVSSERSDGNRLIPTLVHQLIEKLPKIQPSIEKCIGNNNRVFDLGMHAQAESLLVSPVNDLNFLYRLFVVHLAPILRMTYPRLFIIDGLDECSNLEVQRQILEVLAKVARDLNLPFRFLIASRPESHIRDFFDHSPLSEGPVIQQLDLARDQNSDNDIRLFLSRRFTEIVNTHTLREYITLPWPPNDAITEIASRSSGQFIYAATVIKYIRSSKHRPTDRLKVILGLVPVPSSDKPYAALDALYTLIFSSVNHPHFMQIFSLLAIPRTPDDGLGTFNTPDMIDKLLGFQPGDTVLILDDFTSIVAFKKDEPIKYYHASLNDFLLDPSRSERFSVDLHTTHEQLARGYLRFIQNHGDNYDWPKFESDFIAFIKNYGKLTTISYNLENDLKKMGYWSISGTLIKGYCSSPIAFDTSSGFLPLYRLWDAGLMQQLFSQLTRSNLTNPDILQAQLDNFRQNLGILEKELSERLCARLKLSRFKKSMFCSGTACNISSDKNESCPGCQKICPLATELSYLVFYTQIITWGGYAGKRIEQYLKYVQAVAGDMDALGGKNQTKENKSLNQTTFAMFGFEANIDCAIITLLSAGFSATLWVLLQRLETNMDSWTLQNPVFHRCLPLFQELREEIEAYRTRTQESWDRYNEREMDQ